MAYMARVIAAIVAAFIALVSFVFWLAGLGETNEVKPGTMLPVQPETPPAGVTQASQPASEPIGGSD
jgi:hypothetical protein